MITLNNLKTSGGVQRQGKRVGRGNSSGKGTFCGRGVKGQKSRSGGSKGLVKKALQVRLMKFPKFKGFKPRQRKPVSINIGVLEIAFEANAKITPRILTKRGLIVSAACGVKLLGDGTLTKPFIFSRDFLFSSGALDKIKTSGGKIE
ncbi:MAG: 50S ribosomal protein L15 [Parcubacteria group bacterium]|nr:50S ribosomal protein L15 [Parcubacteria group bacterium]